eukprot:scaffold39972_cov35-Prasinocladus_malaysianus.AAC.1
MDTNRLEGVASHCQIKQRRKFGTTNEPWEVLLQMEPNCHSHWPPLVVWSQPAGRAMHLHRQLLLFGRLTAKAMRIVT